MQQALNREGYSLDVDGGFGKKTLAALMDYQRRVGMTPDGVAGSKTWASLGVSCRSAVIFPCSPMRLP